MEKGKVHYAWFVLAGCCALTAGTGMILNTGGQWFVSISTELGVPVSSIAVYITVFGLCMAATAPFVGKLLPKVNIRVLITICYLACILAWAACSLYTKVWMWYITGAVLGVAGAFCFIIPAPVILSQWFVKKNGFAVGLAMTFSGITGAICNPIIQVLIATVGWRMSYVIISVAIAVIVLPFTIFVLRFSPAEKGLKPYGYEETPAAATNTNVAPADLSGVTAKVAYKSLSFWLLFVICGLFTFIAGIGQMLATIANSMGLLEIVGLIASMCMIGNILGKIGLGAISDKLGGVKTGVIGMAIVVAGFILFIIGGSSTVLVLIAALLVGVVLSMTTAIAPILTRSAFGVKDFPSIYASLNIGISLFGAFGTTVIALLADSFGGFVPTFYMGIGICVACTIFIIISLTAAKKLPREA
jgi:MFS family permease